ncbi:hypothetical protein Tsubulata_008936 [Turnera subulata]|uniref:Uncharacterized protein n=1 Tax=Turnera subulata TaxID=218843 RepID=A0A9Q0F1A4_9ROSI|nr:hypothetical protein Tsubulata_008936 [Turnera subulata]
MELLPTPFYATWKRYWRRKGYQRLDGAVTSRRKVTRFGGTSSSPRRSWKIRVVPKLRLKNIASPLKIMRKLKNAYVEMMASLVGNVGALNYDTKAFGSRRVPKAKEVKFVYPGDAFESRLIYEISKTLIPSRELAPDM